MDGKVPAAAGSKLKPAAGKLVKTEQPALCSNSSGNNVADLGVRTDEATAAAVGAERTERDYSGGDQKGATDDHAYADPALLKWRIFEAVAKTNGQRAFATYWSALRDFLRGRLPRSGLDEALEASLGPDNVHLHNELIMRLLNNARCRYLPAELVSQVPASIRGKVVVVQAEVEPALPTTPKAVRSGSKNAPSAAATLSGGGAGPSPFQGKRTEGLLLLNAGDSANGRIDVGNAGNGVADGGSEKMTEGKTCSEFTSMSTASLKIEGDSSSGGGNRSGGQSTPRSVKLEVAGVAPVVKKSEGGSGGDSRRDDDRIRPEGETVSSEKEEEEELWREAQLLEDEIASHFGPGSDLWRSWSVTEGAEAHAAGLQQQQQEEQEAGTSRKRPAVSDEGVASVGEFHKSERSPKAVKREEGASAPVADSAANGALCSAAVAKQKAMGLAAAADDLSPSHQSQRVPAARTLAPFLQALTASQQMKVSHDVCRVMTAGVKEYLRRVIEACLVKARDEQRRGMGTAAAAAAAASRMHVKQAAATATAPVSTAMKDDSSVVSNPSAGGGGVPPLTAAAGIIGGAQRNGGGVLTPGHLQLALETMPRLVGPPSSARSQWRRVATYATEHHQHQRQHHNQCQPPAAAGARGSMGSGPRL